MATADRVYHSRRFVPEFESDTGPLDACLAWVASEAPRSFLVLAHETPHTRREYEALDAEAVARYARTPNAARHAHEVVIGPPKLYADLDAGPDAEAACDALAAALCAAVESQFDVRAKMLVLDASRPGEKVSRHLIVALTHRADGTPARFASNEHVGAFVAAIDTAALADQAVYRHRGCMRLYGSTKLDTPGFPFLPLAAPRRAVASTLEAETWQQSLITWPPVAEDDARLLRVDLMPRTKRPRFAGTASMAAGHDPALLATICAQAPAIAGAQPHSAAVSASGLVIVATSSRACVLAGRTHRSNTVYFMVDAARGRWAHRCHSPHCKSLPFTWHALADSDALTAYVPPTDRRAHLTHSAPARLGRGGAYGATLTSLFKATMRRYRPRGYRTSEVGRPVATSRRAIFTPKTGTRRRGRLPPGPPPLTLGAACFSSSSPDAASSSSSYGVTD